MLLLRTPIVKIQITKCSDPKCSEYYITPKEENVAIYRRNIVYRRVSTRYFGINIEKSVISRDISAIFPNISHGQRVNKS